MENRRKWAARRDQAEFRTTRLTRNRRASFRFLFLVRLKLILFLFLSLDDAGASVFGSMCRISAELCLQTVPAALDLDLSPANCRFSFFGQLAQE